MGNLIGSPVDSGTQREVEDLIKAVLATFTTEYVKAYALALVAKAKLDAQEEPSEMLLEEREPSKANRLEGWMVKQGAVRKNWKKRYFVVRHDYVVDYYVSEEEAKKENGKRKGTMGLCGYYVIDDVNNGILKRLRTLAEKMGMDVSELPKPKEYPEFTLEVHHDRRRCYFITCEDKESFKKWVEEFQVCCRRAYGLRDKEWVHERAFHEAVRKTRWSLGRWGWWSYGGNEEQILSDLIVDELEYAVMGRIYSKITGPWVVRNKIRKVIIKAMDTMVAGAVAPAWKVMGETVSVMRPKVEPSIKELADPLGKMEAELVAKIREAVMSTLEPLLKEHVAPHMQKPVDIIRGPLRESFEEAHKIWSEHVIAQEQHLIDDAGKQKAYRHLDWVPWGWEMWRATDKFDATYEVLWDLRIIFSDIQPWSLIWKARDQIRKTTDNAVYTYEKKLDEQTPLNAEASGRAREEVMEDFVHDSRLATRNLCEEILKLIIMPLINSVVRTPCKALLEPLASAIPDNMKDFLDINKLFDDVLDDVIHHSIVAVLGDEGIEAGSSKKKHHHKEKHEHKAHADLRIEYSQTKVESFHSFNYPGHFIRHTNGEGWAATDDGSDLWRQDTTWQVVAGLADPKAVSFESVNYPGYFLRHRDGLMVLNQNDGSELFRKDATFHTREGLAGSGRSFESSNFPGHFIRHQDARLKITPHEDSELYLKDATWVPVQANNAGHKGKGKEAEEHSSSNQFSFGVSADAGHTSVSVEITL